MCFWIWRGLRDVGANAEARVGASADWFSELEEVIFCEGVRICSDSCSDAAPFWVMVWVIGLISISAMGVHLGLRMVQLQHELSPSNTFSLYRSQYQPV